MKNRRKNARRGCTLANMIQIDKQWDTYQQIIKWFVAKYRKGEISRSMYISHVSKTSRMMQEMIINSGK
ncbi:MAG: hypothetical protein ACOC01_01770 [Bacteroidales bacterium]